VTTQHGSMGFVFFIKNISGIMARKSTPSSQKLSTNASIVACR